MQVQGVKEILAGSFSRYLGSTLLPDQKMFNQTNNFRPQGFKKDVDFPASMQDNC